ncbi:MAG: monovalent cation/H(+) antiporter subunit G [Dehalococcoidales bacterium]|nr:monovalent cation/H(+) antiporter subunit G [Dehalococcoidales bacterium]
MTVQIIIAAIFIVGGLFFLFVSSLGIIRMPDFYTRCHAISKSETLGSMLLLFGLAVFNGIDTSSLKLLSILVFIALANPTATHIIARAAHRAGLRPWSLRKPLKKMRDVRLSAFIAKKEAVNAIITQDKQI